MLHVDFLYFEISLDELRVRRGYGLSSEPPGSQQIVDNRLWSLEEKRQLLGGLRKHGSKRMAQVAEEVPSKSLEQVFKKVVRNLFCSTMNDLVDSIKLAVTIIGEEI